MEKLQKESSSEPSELDDALNHEEAGEDEMSEEQDGSEEGEYEKEELTSQAASDDDSEEGSSSDEANPSLQKMRPEVPR